MKEQILKTVHERPLTPSLNIRGGEIKHKIYFSINGEGYGHSSRALAIAKQLHPEEVLLGSYGYSLKRLESTGLPTIEITPEVSFVGKDGSFDIGLTILKNSSWPVAINQIINEERKIIQNYGITCVVSDSRTAPIFAASKLGLPCILLTNQTTFAPFFDVEINDLEDSLIEKSFKDWLRTGTKAVLTNAAETFVMKVVQDWLKAADEIFIPELPPPNSICLPLLCNENFVKKKQRFIGPLLPWSWKSIVQNHDKNFLPPEYHGFKKKIVCTLGGHRYRKPLFDTVLLLAKIMPDVLFIILSDFKSDLNLPNLYKVGFVNNPAEFYLNADLVITQAGHSTAMELITLGLPMLVIPDCGQVEQESNARRLCELGIASRLSYKDLKTDTMYSMVQYMLNEPSFLNHVNNLSKLAKNYMAEKEAVRIIRDYSTRIQAY